MRTLYGHLDAIGMGTEIANLRKPVLRSSAIFPVIHSADFTTRISFLGYWLLKRNISEVSILYTLRNEAGTIISRKFASIKTAKSYNIELREFEQHFVDGHFVGSLELEINSVVDLVYPYPAFIVVYYNDHSSTAVHTVGRIYNDIEDLQNNEEFRVKESGFDIYGHRHLQPFIAFTNGPIPNEHPSIQYVLTDDDRTIGSGSFPIEPLAAYETRYLKFKDYIDLEQLVGNKKASIKIGHNFEGFFPRFLSGNWDEKMNAMSITHSFYDSSDMTDAKAYWHNTESGYVDGSVNVPVYLQDGYETEIVLYPIFSPSDFSISLEYFDAGGKSLLVQHDVVRSAQLASKYYAINVGKCAAKDHLDISAVASVNINCNWEDKTRIPTRLKLGLNIGRPSADVIIPCNICFAPQVADKKVVQKPGTFKWSPILNVGSSEIIISNSSFEKSYDRPANITVSFFNTTEGERIERQYTLAPNANLKISIRDDEALRNFCNGETSWLSVQSDNPFVAGWYFDFHESGSVAGDHMF